MGDEYYDDDNLEYVDMPELPERPVSRRSSLPGGYSECDMEIPELPELPHQVRLSRQSLKSDCHLPPHITSSEFNNRYSLLSDENEQETSYFQDMFESEPSDMTHVTRRAYKDTRGREEYQSAVSDDLSDDSYTETSYNSDDDATEADPLDPENTRKLERDIKKLIKDLQKRTEED